MESAYYHPPHPEVPFHLGAMVVARSDEYHQLNDRIGYVDGYEWPEDLGSSYPDDPLIIVDFGNGQKDGFWAEELLAVRFE